jgi:biopolymer transport protein ExbD
MAFGKLDSSEPPRPVAEINTTPLVDGMLVLLILFISTAPLLTHAVKIDLPDASSQANPGKPTTVTIAIDAAGALYRDGERIPEEAMAARLAEAGRAAAASASTGPARRRLGPGTAEPGSCPRL